MSAITELVRTTIGTNGNKHIVTDGLFVISKTVPTVSVIIPTLNEAKNLPHVLPRIPKWVDQVILIDGHSEDETVAVARSVQPDITILEQPRCGKGDALATGCRAARGDILVMMDADGSTDPSEIPLFVATLRAGADYAKGTRCIQGSSSMDMPTYRYAGNWMLTQFANALFGTRFSDITYGYNAVWRHHLDLLALECDGWPFEIINCIRAARYGLRVVEVPSVEYRRIAGKAKLGAFSAGWSIFQEIARERFRRLDGSKIQRRTPVTLGKMPDQQM